MRGVMPSRKWPVLRQSYGTSQGSAGSKNDMVGLRGFSRIGLSARIMAFEHMYFLGISYCGSGSNPSSSGFKLGRKSHL